MIHPIYPCFYPKLGGGVGQCAERCILGLIATYSSARAKRMVVSTVRILTEVRGITCSMRPVLAVVVMMLWLPRQDSNLG